jgi:nicotinamidase/pyrazinamidase
VVDVQRDFCPRGALPAKHGDDVILGLNPIVSVFRRLGLPLFFTRDWHPAHHVSFRDQGGPWPPHCIAGTRGAEFHPDLLVPPEAAIISKGTSRGVEAYSAFQGTDLERRLKKASADEIIIGGLTTDYCVKESALDGLRAGFLITILEDCVRPVDARAGDGERALAEVKAAGATTERSPSVIKRVAGTQQ